MALLGVQRRVPWVQVVAHGVQVPLTQNVLAAHCCTGPQAGQVFASMMQVSTPPPLQRDCPAVQLVPQVPQAPPLQNVVHVCEVRHCVHPEASATQDSTFLPTHRVVPAVQAVLQAVQLVPWHTVPIGQVRPTQAVQPVDTVSSQVSTPVAVHRELVGEHGRQLLHAPLLHTSP
jgi:hypothetical protein